MRQACDLSAVCKPCPNDPKQTVTNNHQEFRLNYMNTNRSTVLILSIVPQFPSQPDHRKGLSLLHSQTDERTKLAWLVGKQTKYLPPSRTYPLRSTAKASAPASFAASFGELHASSSVPLMPLFSRTPAPKSQVHLTAQLVRCSNSDLTWPAKFALALHRSSSQLTPPGLPRPSDSAHH